MSEPARVQEPHAPAAATLREVLFPSDLSAASDRAFDHARFLAERFGSHLTIYHAVEVPRPEDAEGPWDARHEAFRRAERAAREHIDRHLARLQAPHDVFVERATSPHRALVARIQAARPDLTVMATHGRDGLAHLVLGSVTEMVLQHSRAPILCVRQPDHGAALPYRRILVPTDLSGASRRPFPMAGLLARAFDAEILAVHVAPLPTPASLSGIPELVESRVPAEQTLRRFLEPDFRGLRVSVRIQAGSPWDRIIETARTEKADVIVMSTHGHDSLSDRIVGSHTERVVRHAPCPVLVV